MAEMTDVLAPGAAPGAPPAPALAPPSTAEAARARRAAIIADPALGEKFRNGDVVLRAEMRTLNMAISAAPTGDKLGAVLAGTATPGGFETTTGSELPTSDLISAVDGLRKQGHSDEIIRAILEGAPVTPERHREAELMRERLMRDRKWLQDYRAGSSDHVQQMHNINAVLAAPVIGAK
jgi:hypothetical protein